MGRGNRTNVRAEGWQAWDARARILPETYPHPCSDAPKGVLAQYELHLHAIHRKSQSRGWAEAMRQGSGQRAGKPGMGRPTFCQKHTRILTPKRGVSAQHALHLHAIHRKSQSRGWAEAMRQSQCRSLASLGWECSQLVRNIPTYPPGRTLLKPFFSFTEVKFALASQLGEKRNANAHTNSDSKISA